MRSLRNRLPNTSSTTEGNNGKRSHKTKKKYEDTFYSSDDLVRREKKEDQREIERSRRDKEREMKYIPYIYDLIDIFILYRVIWLKEEQL